MSTVDWILQIARVLKMKNPHTLYLAISIMDRYLRSKGKEEEQFTENQMYIIGATSLYMSSKLEENKAIQLKELIVKACYSKFKVG